MMHYSLYSASEWVFPDSENTGSKAIAIYAARNGYVGFQCKLTGLKKGMSLTVSRPYGSPLNLETYRLIDVNVNRNTGVNGFVWTDEVHTPDYVTRKAPFRVYDALRPYRAGNESADDEVCAFYFCYCIPTFVTPGDYHETITVSTGDETVEIPVTLRVYSAVIPNRGRLHVTNWYSLSNMASRHGLELWSEVHWEMIRRYGLMMRRARQDTFMVSPELCDTTTENGRVILDFSRAKRLISMYFDLGFTTIEGAQVLWRENWDAESFFTYDGEEKTAFPSPRAYRALREYYTAFGNFLKENGWYDRLTQHVGDEPHDRCRNGYIEAASVVRQCLPGVPIIEAVESANFAGAVDIFVPKNDYYQRNREAFEEHRTNGAHLWFYTCCIPGGRFVNRLLDKPLVEARYLFWGNFKYRLEGYLHWGLNQYSGHQDPFEHTSPDNRERPELCLPAGDTHIVYPGDDGPWSSMRLENNCFGVQDYELLTMLADKDAEKAQALADRLVRAFDDVEYDVNIMEETRQKLLEALDAE